MNAKLPHLIQRLFKARTERKKAEVPDNLFLQCPSCQNTIYRKKIEHNHHICPHCEHHFMMSSKDWTELLFDKNSIRLLFSQYKTMDILDFPGYSEKIKKYAQKGVNEGVDTGKAKIKGIPVLFAIMNSDFMMGSMGSVVGERITRLFEKGANQNLPVLIVSRSGGARMQEGAISLMQMTKISAAIKRFSKTGNLYLSLLTHPTTGGVTASFSMLGDINIAEPEALIGFAGPRVIEQTIKQKLPEGFQRSEFLQEKGFVDLICQRRNIQDTLYNILKLHRY